MTIPANIIFALLLFGSLRISIGSCGQSNNDRASLSRSSFPPGFVIGTSTSAYQCEGGANEGGKGPSLWDVYTHKYPGKVQDAGTGDIADDSYHRYKEDVGLIKAMNMDAYRFSIAWTRILPKGKLSGGVSLEGIKYYNDLIDELLANGIQPYVTLFHWDTPQALEDEYDGFLSPLIAKDYQDYADICFKEFGDRVKHWMTINELWTYSAGGYAANMLAPWRCSPWQGLNCTGGDSATEPYTVAHHILLAHSAAVQLYRSKYQGTQKGQIGISLAANWMIPYSSAQNHQDAAQRHIDFTLGWSLDPITKGDYPQSMRTLVGNRLPQFTKEQSDLLRGSFDFIGLNYYTTSYTDEAPPGNASYTTDSRSKLLMVRDGVPIGPKANMPWLYVYPKGLWELLVYTKNNYNSPDIYITECGLDEANDPKIPLEQALNDTMRIDYYYDHLSYCQKAINDGVNLKGFFAWTLLDDFEWSSGYTSRFGLHFVDYKNGQKRYPKNSARWFQNFLKK